MGLPAKKLSALPSPTFDLEAAMMDQYQGPVAGIDEAGRGPWAGPVVIAAVILNPDRIPEGLNDSKVLTPEVREDRYEEIVATSLVSIIIGPVKRIDRINILQASLWGMRAAYRGLGVPIGAALIDGNIIPRRFPCKARAIVGGDGLSLSVAAASIVAKVTRDRLMVKLVAALSPLCLGQQQGLRHAGARGRPSRSTACASITAAPSRRSSARSACIEGGGELPLPASGVN